MVRALADSEDTDEWALPMANASSISVDDTDGNRDAVASNGISLCAFITSWDKYVDASAAAPAAVEPGRWYEANGIILGTSVQANQDGVPFMVLAFPFSQKLIRGVHDGSTNSNTYFQDSSIDFEESGVEGGGTWIIINESNDNYAYIKEVQRPAGQKRKCRLLTATDASGTATTAADFDTNDVVYCVPLDEMQYPLSGIGLMT